MNIEDFKDGYRQHLATVDKESSFDAALLYIMLLVDPTQRSAVDLSVVNVVASGLHLNAMGYY